MSPLKIAIAKDAAFNFTYRALTDSLMEAFDVTWFSPLRDEHLPDCDCLYLPGGYPELFAKELEANKSMRDSIKDFAERGGHIYAECGGFMYLTRSIDGIAMCGVLPLEATMQGAKLHLGYREMEASVLACPITSGFKGRTIKGHEFHYSTIKPYDELPADVSIVSGQRTARGTEVDTEIFRYKNVIAGYTHWYFCGG